MNVKDHILVSSTYADLKDERNEVINACLNWGTRVTDTSWVSRKQEKAVLMVLDARSGMIA